MISSIRHKEEEAEKFMSQIVRQLKTKCKPEESYNEKDSLCGAHKMKETKVI